MKTKKNPLSVDTPAVRGVFYLFTSVVSLIFIAYFTTLYNEIPRLNLQLEIH